jgi:protein-disulfide isomerase/uncharacterized membrane protein
MRGKPTINRAKLYHLLTLFLSILGIGVSLLAIRERAVLNGAPNGDPSFCDINEAFSCSKVISSEYGYLFGVSLGVYAVGFYTAFFLLNLYALYGHSPQVVNAINKVFALISLLISILLFAISSFFIGALCPLCLAIYGINIVIFIFISLLPNEGGYLATLLKGVADILRSPLTFFTVKGEKMVWASLSLMIIGVALYLALSYERTIVKEVVSKTALNRSPHIKSVQELITEWRNSPLIPTGVIKDRDLATKGPKDAPVQILEFSDFECPACRQAYLYFEDLYQRYPGKIRLQYRNYPLDKKCNLNMQVEMHKFACDAARFALCAGEQGSFWRGVEYLFTSNVLQGLSAKNDEKGVKDHFRQGIADLKLDETKFITCQEKVSVRIQLQEDIDLASSLGIDGTPAVWINNRKLPVLRQDLLEGIVRELK